MARVLLFNPENDVRLGETPGRTPRKLTPNVVALSRDGALLPMWWAEDDDFILVRRVPANERAAVETRAADLKRRFGLSGTIVFEGDTIDKEATGAPWGWSYDSAAALRAVGALCPPESAIEAMRQLSHRRTASEISKRLAGKLPFAIPEPAVECRSVEDVEAFICAHSGAYVKTPWSSSGRGVMPLSDVPDERVKQNIRAAIERQGCVMCEVPLNGVRNFAMLFFAEGGRVEYRGLSVFENNGGTAYGGNIVTAEEQLETMLVASGADLSELNSVRTALVEVLTEILGKQYTGWLGMDMLVLDDGSPAPCIELNLRMTMGVVAWLLARRLESDNLPGQYSVVYGKPQAGAISIAGDNPDATFSFQYRKNM